MFHTIAATICLANVGCIATYYGLYGVTEHVYVSDLIFDLLSYRVLMSLLTGLQILLCFAAACQEIREEVFFWFEMIGLTLCAVGWITLNAMYKNPSDNAVSTGHIVGTGLYVAGNVVNFLFMLRATDRTRWVWVLAAVILASIFAGIGFLVGFFSNQEFGWICEHWAVMLVAVAHFVFFSLLACAPEEETPYELVPVCVDVPIIMANRKSERASTATETPRRCTPSPALSDRSRSCAQTTCGAAPT